MVVLDFQAASEESVMSSESQIRQDCPGAPSVRFRYVTPSTLPKTVRVLFFFFSSEQSWGHQSSDLVELSKLLVRVPVP